MEIRTLTENQRKRVSSLARKKGRVMHRQFLVEGLRSVEAAVQGQAPISEILGTEAVLGDPANTSWLASAGAPLYRMTEKVARSVSTVEHGQGIVAVVGISEGAHAALSRFDAILALDGVQDPGNVGTIVRTAAWFGVQAVLAGPGTADLYNPKVVRASMGGLWDTCVLRVDDLTEELFSLKSKGFRVCGAALSGELITEWMPADQTVLVIGSEARGLSASVRKLLDREITIPGQAGLKGAESLNAATAAGILMYRWKERALRTG